MAVLKNGKLVGRVGNLVYRNVKGRTVVQSRPRPPKGGFKLTSRNSDFRVASKAASALYRELKDFALNLTTRQLYNSIVRLLMENREVIQPEGADNEWSLVPDGHLLPVERRPNLLSLLDGNLVAELADGTYRIQIPALERQHQQITSFVHPVWKDTAGFERTYILIHYDFETMSTSIVDQWTSRRDQKTAKGKSVLIERGLADFKDFPISTGLLLLSVGLKLYASSSSSTYLNRPEYNPFVVAGIWRKH